MRGWISRCRWVVRHLCWNGGEPDPRVLQSSFTLILAAALAFRIAGEGPVSPVSWPVAGVAISTIGSLVVLTAPAARVEVLARVLAVVHISALGMLAQGPDLGISSALVVFPSIWLGLELGGRGVALATGSTVAFVALPGLLSRGVGLVNVEWLLLLTVLAGFSAFATNAALIAARTAQARAEAREAELAVALEVIERNRRSAHAVFEAVDVGLALLDREGRPALVNQRFTGFSDLAFPVADPAAGVVFDESGTAQLPSEQVPTSRARRGEEFDDVRVWVGRDDGARRALSMSARRVEAADGRVVGAALSCTDVTDLMRALKVKEDFVALVSHELRTPLTSIVGYVAVALERTDLDPVLHKQLDAVARNGQRLERLVQDLLDEVQHSAGPIPLREQDTDLAVIVRECVAGARSQASRVGVQLDAEVPEQIAFTGDPQRLAQVVDNLVSNAIKYTEPGGSARVLATVDDGCVRITIKDTGIGIEPADQARMFSRFVRGAEANRRAIQGIGLGLSIAKSIVESHGGQIEVDSAPGCGSEFRVVLPLHAAQLAS